MPYLEKSSWSERHEQFVSDVEKINGVAIVLAPYGVKKMKVEGKTYLVAMTADEQAKFLKDNKIESDPIGTCMYSAATGFCHLNGGCTRCAWRDDDIRSSCYCAG